VLGDGRIAVHGGYHLIEVNRRGAESSEGDDDHQAGAFYSRRPCQHASESEGAAGSGPFDRRLLRRATAARWALAADAGAGLLGTILLLAQVTILAEVIGPRDRPVR
jgi:hypothetical protein